MLCFIPQALPQASSAVIYGTKVMIYNISMRSNSIFDGIYGLHFSAIAIQCVEVVSTGSVRDHHSRSGFTRTGLPN